MWSIVMYMVVMCMIMTISTAQKTAWHGFDVDEAIVNTKTIQSEPANYGHVSPKSTAQQERDCSHLGARIPRFMLLGSPHCGTSVVWDILKHHRSVFGPQVEQGAEVHFFDDEQSFQSGCETYADFFAGIDASSPDVFIGDMSTSYLTSPKATTRILQSMPRKTKFVTMLCDPNQRAYDHYLAWERSGFPPQACRSTLLNRYRESFDELVRQYVQHPDENCAIFDNSDFGKLLSPWVPLWKENRLEIIFQRDMQARPLQVLEKMSTFLEIPPWTLSELNWVVSEGFHVKNQVSRLQQEKHQFSSRAILAEHFRPSQSRLAQLLPQFKTMASDFVQTNRRFLQNSPTVGKLVITTAAATGTDGTP